MKLISAIFLLQFVALSLSFPTQATGTGLEFNGKNVSADLKNMPLKNILSELERERGIRWEASSDVSGKKISMQIKDEYMEDAIKRILSNMNYALLFDAGGKMTRILVFGENGDSPIGLGSRATHPSITPSISMGKGMAVRVPARELGQKIGYFIKNSDNIGKSAIDAKEAARLEAGQKDVSRPAHALPGSSRTGGQGEMQDPEISNNSSSALNAPKPTAEQMDGFKVLKNLPAPGGNVHPSQDILRTFKVRKNLPAPGVVSQK